MDIVIVTGLSGSGKSLAIHSLEDLGYYCVDNLPAVLLPEFIDQLNDRPDAGIDRLAVGIDSRNRNFLGELPATLASLEEHGTNYHMLYLEADDETLIKRYSETRRKHPLTDESVSLADGIAIERSLVEPLADYARRRIDTSRLTPHELRRLVRDTVATSSSGGPVVLFESFGFKHGIPRDADFVFDVRCLPNPHWDLALRGLTGLDPDVAGFLENQPEVNQMIDQIYTFIDSWLPNFVKENRSYVTVAVGCTGGRHRSVYIARRLTEKFAAQSLAVQVRHRELN